MGGIIPEEMISSDELREKIDSIFRSVIRRLDKIDTIIYNYHFDEEKGILCLNDATNMTQFFENMTTNIIKTLNFRIRYLH